MLWDISVYKTRNTERDSRLLSLFTGCCRSAAIYPVQELTELIINSVDAEYAVGDAEYDIGCTSV